MIRSGNSTRFTQTEVDEFRHVGLDIADVKHQNDLDAVVTRWAYILAYERFDLLEQIATQMAKVKGVKLPPKLTVCGETEMEHGPDSVPQFRGDATAVKALRVTNST
jgi:hypothetical protein